MPGVPGDRPTPRITMSAGPLRGVPPNSGLTATRLGCRATASRIPSMARIGHTESGGFDGAITTVSALSIASTTPGAGSA